MHAASFNSTLVTGLGRHRILFEHTGSMLQFIIFWIQFKDFLSFSAISCQWFFVNFIVDKGFTAHFWVCWQCHPKWPKVDRSISPAPEPHLGLVPTVILPPREWSLPFSLGLIFHAPAQTSHTCPQNLAYAPVMHDYSMSADADFPHRPTVSTSRAPGGHITSIALPSYVTLLSLYLTTWISPMYMAKKSAC